jgi:hypothetical protein
MWWIFNVSPTEGDAMKRNWDTIRDLLTKLEECTIPSDMLRLSSFPVERAAEISYHMEILFEAGLVDGQMSKTIGPGPYDFFATRLTWNGHEFLDSIRSDTIWNKTKTSFVRHGISMTFDLIKSVASEVATSYLKSAIIGQ